jgi:hypothetical protein
MKTVKILMLLPVCVTSIALADDFKTTDGKEYKNAAVSRVEPDGIMIRFSGGLVKIPFTELPKEDQERFHYDPKSAVAAQAAEMAAIQQTNQQTEESNKQRKETEQQKALENRLTQLQQDEESLRIQTRQANNAPTIEQHSQDAARKLLRDGAEESMTVDQKNAQYAARLNYYEGLKQAAARRGSNANNIVPPKWGEADWYPLGRGSAPNGAQAPVSETDRRVLQTQLDSVRKDKERVRRELERTQHR